MTVYYSCILENCETFPKLIDEYSLEEDDNDEQ